VNDVTLRGGGGIDRLTLTGGSGVETVSLRPGSADLAASGYHVAAGGFERIHFVGGREDRAWLFDSAGNDRFTADHESARLAGFAFENSVIGVGSVVAMAGGGGMDLARLNSALASDAVQTTPTGASLRGVGFAVEARGFQQVNAVAAGESESPLLATGQPSSVTATSVVRASGVLSARKTDLAVRDYVFHTVGRDKRS
jgi:hypothetical protein